MKYIEVTGWGNHRKHLIPLNKVVDFNFEKDYTTISLVNGKTVNIIENEFTIKEMLGFHNVNLVNEEKIHTLYNEYDEDELPF